ncbi:hypothetical protein F4780DRAFT_790332 [Xylariomycetidae sp. FL0641]|nr:hypothetical protein F4780DRAFT_790332 [Xylariomycetidae sp. FL0641]
MRSVTIIPLLSLVGLGMRCVADDTFMTKNSGLPGVSESYRTKPRAKEEPDVAIEPIQVLYEVLGLPIDASEEEVVKTANEKLSSTSKELAEHDTYYDKLDLEKDASEEDIKSAVKLELRLAEMQGAEQRVGDLQKAKEILLGPKRCEYDFRIDFDWPRLNRCAAMWQARLNEGHEVKPSSEHSSISRPWKDYLQGFPWTRRFSTDGQTQGMGETGEPSKEMKKKESSTTGDHQPITERTTMTEKVTTTGRRTDEQSQAVIETGEQAKETKESDRTSSIVEQEGQTHPEASSGFWTVFSRLLNRAQHPSPVQDHPSPVQDEQDLPEGKKETSSLGEQQSQAVPQTSSIVKQQSSAHAEESHLTDKEETSSTDKPQIPAPQSLTQAEEAASTAWTDMFRPWNRGKQQSLAPAEKTAKETAEETAGETPSAVYQQSSAQAEGTNSTAWTDMLSPWKRGKQHSPATTEETAEETTEEMAEDTAEETAEETTEETVEETAEEIAEETPSAVYQKSSAQAEGTDSTAWTDMLRPWKRGKQHSPATTEETAEETAEVTAEEIAKETSSAVYQQSSAQAEDTASTAWMDMFRPWKRDEQQSPAPAEETAEETAEEKSEETTPTVYQQSPAPVEATASTAWTDMFRPWKKGKQHSPAPAEETAAETSSAVYQQSPVQTDEAPSIVQQPRPAQAQETSSTLWDSITSIWGKAKPQAPEQSKEASSTAQRSSQAQPEQETSSATVPKPSSSEAKTKRTGRKGKTEKQKPSVEEEATTQREEAKPERTETTKAEEEPTTTHQEGHTLPTESSSSTGDSDPKYSGNKQLVAIVADIVLVVLLCWWTELPLLAWNQSRAMRRLVTGELAVGQFVRFAGEVPGENARY